MSSPDKLNRGFWEKIKENPWVPIGAFTTGKLHLASAAFFSLVSTLRWYLGEWSGGLLQGQSRHVSANDGEKKKKRRHFYCPTFN